MNFAHLLDSIIGALEAEDVPANFIVQATLVQMNGVEKVIHGKELQEFLSNRKKYRVMETRVVLDVTRLRFAIAAHIEDFFTSLDTRLAGLSEP